MAGAITKRLHMGGVPLREESQCDQRIDYILCSLMTGL